MHRIWKKRLVGLAIALTVLVLCMPLAMLVTILMVPLWRWIESTYSIEAIGHSGPAEWCYMVVYAGMVTFAGIVWLCIRYKSLEKS